MTVRDLIEELENYPDDMEVEFAYNYGDYGNTIVCEKARQVYEGEVQYSSYHQMDKLADDDEDEEENKDKRNVVIIQ